MNDLQKNNGQIMTTDSAVRRGLEEGAEQDELIIPRANLLQALSPDVVEGKETPDGKPLKSGMIINSLTKEIMPEVFIPIKKFNTWFWFNPRDSKDPRFNADFEPGALMHRSNDAKDPMVMRDKQFGEDGSKPKATQFMNFLAYFPGVSTPVVISFANTSFKAGKNLLSLIQFCSKGDIFSRRYKLTSKFTENAKGKFYIFETKSAGETSQDEFQIAEKLWELYARDVDSLNVDEPDQGATNSDGEAAPWDK